MQVHHVGPTWPSYVIPAIIIAVVFALRMRRVNQARPLRLDRLWVVPAIFFAAVLLSFVAQPPSAGGWIASAVGLLIGAGLGWQRGKTIAIHVDPETGELNQKTSIAGMAFLLILVLVKSGARAGGAAMHLDVSTLTDATMALALGTFTLMRIEMYLRARRLLADSRGPGATAIL